MRHFLLRFTSFFRAGRAEAELSREIAAHLQLLEDQFIAQGMPADEARYAARRAFGGQIPACIGRDAFELCRQAS
jgi:hypothetical protein